MSKRGKFDYILLETSGLADPGNYFQILIHCRQVNAFLTSYSCHVLWNVWLSLRNLSKYIGLQVNRMLLGAN